MSLVYLNILAKCSCLCCYYPDLVFFVLPFWLVFLHLSNIGGFLHLSNIRKAELLWGLTRLREDMSGLESGRDNSFSTHQYWIGDSEEQEYRSPFLMDL